MREWGRGVWVFESNDDRRGQKQKQEKRREGHTLGNNK